MHVELLVVPDCPHQPGATSLLRTSLDELGFDDATIDTTVIDTVEAAQQRGFIGSPTFLVNGTDAFPIPGHRPAIACRLYSNRNGLAGLPGTAAAGHDPGRPARSVHDAGLSLNESHGRRSPIHRSSPPITGL